MKLSLNNHLCYSLNVFPGEDWRRLNVLRQRLPILRQLISGASGKPFALGLWLPADAASELLKNETVFFELKDYLAKNSCYVCTINAFPYGVFHGRRVKESVYRPDWITDARRDYTCNVADLLAKLLPDGLVGSISTLPGCYGKADGGTLEAITNNYLKTAGHLKKLKDETGKKIVLAIEMEPDCLWDDPQDFADYYKSKIAPHSELAQHIGVCYDTCHQELTGRKPGEGLSILKSAGVPVAKVQLSAALRAANPDSKTQLSLQFADEVYLHQTRAVAPDGSLTRYPDLPAALDSADRNADWLVHFHVPLYVGELGGGLSAAKAELLATLSEIVKSPGLCPHLEIETYTYAVLPEQIRKSTLEASMAAEYDFVLRKWGALKGEAP